MAKGKGRHWNDHVEKVINDKRKGFKKFLSTGKMKDKIHSHKRTSSKQKVCTTHRIHSHKRAISKQKVCKTHRKAQKRLSLP
jgi:hypothetical protein